MEKIQLYKKANDKAGAEVDPKDPTKQKWNAETVFVKIENEMVPLSELAKHAKENSSEFEAIQTVENDLEINGQVHNASELIERYKASKNKKNEDDADKKEIKKGEEKGAEETVTKKNEEEKKEEKKDNEVAGSKEDNKDVVSEKKNESEEAKGDKDKEKKEGAKDEEEDVEGKIKKDNSKKDVQHFVRLNTARENGHLGGTVMIDTMHNRIDRGKSRYGTSAS